MMASSAGHGYGFLMIRRAYLGLARRRPALAWLGVAVLACGPSAASAETLLVVRKSGDAVSFVDPGSGLTLASVSVGHAPHEVSRSPDGRFAAVTNYGTRDRPGSTLSIIDLEHPRELRRIDLGEHRRPHGVAWFDPERIAVTTEGSRSLLVVDPRAGHTVAQISTGQDGSHMVAITPGHDRAFVTNLAGGSTTAIDLVNGRKLGDVPTGRGSEAIAITPDGGEVWVAAREAETITVFDSRTLAALATFPLPGRPIRIVISPYGTALVSCAASSEIVVFDVRSRRETGRTRIDVPSPGTANVLSGSGPVAGGPVPVGLALAGDAASVHVAATAADKIVQLALPDLAVLRVLTVPGEPDGMALTPVMPKGDCHACEAPADPYGD
jgi:DNA-binding beta-propeller fold protein YncE